MINVEEMIVIMAFVLAVILAFVLLEIDCDGKKIENVLRWKLYIVAWVVAILALFAMERM